MFDKCKEDSIYIKLLKLIQKKQTLINKYNTIIIDKFKEDGYKLLSQDDRIIYCSYSVFKDGIKTIYTFEESMALFDLNSKDDKERVD